VTRETPAKQPDGRVAIVTGAAGAIGSAIADRLAREAGSVLRVDLTGDVECHADLATATGNQLMVKEAVRRFGRLDTLILNAGLQHTAPLAEFPEVEWTRLMNVMASGPFLAIQAAWPHLAERGDGRIVATASTSSYRAEPQKVAYTAAKHALLGIVRVAALEGGPVGIRANAVAPGWTWTPMVAAQVTARARESGVDPQQVITEMLSRQPVARFIEPREVAEAVAFLAGDQGSAVTGACLDVDLGLMVA
jgi:3-hydroxybutyrate dehydrogenase